MNGAGDWSAWEDDPDSHYTGYAFYTDAGTVSALSQVVAHVSCPTLFLEATPRHPLRWRATATGKRNANAKLCLEPEAMLTSRKEAQSWCEVVLDELTHHTAETLTVLLTVHGTYGGPGVDSLDLLRSVRQALEGAVAPRCRDRPLLQVGRTLACVCLRPTSAQRWARPTGEWCPNAQPRSS